LDVEKEVAARSAEPLNDYDWQIARERISAAQKWLNDYADEEEKLVLYLDTIPERANQLSPEQTNYVEALLKTLVTVESWDGESLQTALFATTRELDLKMPVAFSAIYLAFLNKERGPKAGPLLSYLDRQLVLDRLQAVLDLNRAAV
jgi:lysyl-tRNA synthetase class 1